MFLNCFLIFNEFQPHVFHRHAYYKKTCTLITTLHKGQLIQNFAAKVVTGMHKFDHMIPALNYFNGKTGGTMKDTQAVFAV